MFRLFKKAEKDLSVTVDAPIVMNAKNYAGVEPLLDYVKSLESNSHAAIAAAEGKRLGPYFNAMSRHLSQTLKQSQLPAEEVQAAQDVASPEGLLQVFNTIAERTQNLLISDVAILPMNVLETGPASHFFLNQKQFNTKYDVGGYQMSFGFLQVYQGGEAEKEKSSITFPIFLLDERMTEQAAKFGGEKLLRGLQSALTFVNHDMLHHLTLPIISNSTVAKKLTSDGVALPEDPLDNWLQKLPSNEISRNFAYEDWAQIGQERLMLSDGNAAQVEAVKKTVDEYFGELKRLGSEIAKKSPVDGHVFVDFYGMAMAHTLGRVFALNHPVMEHCLDSLYAADPKPSSPKDCAAEMISLGTPGTDSIFRDVRDIVETGMFTGPVIEGYRKQGLDLVPEKEEDVTWRLMKQLQVVRISAADTRPHVPDPTMGSIKQLRTNVDDDMIGMVSAAARTFRPA